MPGSAVRFFAYANKVNDTVVTADISIDLLILAAASCLVINILLLLLLSSLEYDQNPLCVKH
jgi:hypothetical protein